MARTVYVTTEVTGGGSALDGIDGADLVAGDMAFYINKHTTAPGQEGDHCGIYMATTRGSTQVIPHCMTPDDNSSQWNWELMEPLRVIQNTTGKTATLHNFGVSVLRSTAATVHTLRRPRRGARKLIIFGSTTVQKVRLSSAAAAYTVRVGTSGSTMSVIAFSSRMVGAAGFDELVRPSISLVGVSTRLWRVENLFPWSTNKIKFSSST